MPRGAGLAGMAPACGTAGCTWTRLARGCAHETPCRAIGACDQLGQRDRCPRPRPASDKATAAIGGLRWRNFAEEEVRNALDAAPVRRVLPPESLA
jgi:hypothetical protein